MNKKIIQVILSDEAEDFIRLQPLKAQQKIAYNIRKLENTDIWELRTLFNGTCFRLFSFWDTEQQTLVIATHGIIKKTQKTPSKEIEKAEQIRNIYFNEKNK